MLKNIRELQNGIDQHSGSRVCSTLTCMESRQSSSSFIKGSSISRVEASDDVTLDFFRLKWRSCETDDRSDKQV